MLREFVTEIFEKAVRSFVENMEYDERWVDETGDTFVNDYIMLSKLKGKVGRVEPEGDGKFPASWQQKADVINRLMEVGNEQINKALFYPQNAELLKKVVGIPEFHIPGADSRNKQWREIHGLLKEKPMPSEEEPVEGGEAEQKTSIPTIFDMDDDQVEFEICKVFLNSDRGYYARQFNPDGYMNVLLHAREHKKNLEIKMEQQSGRTPPGEAPESQE
jgi:hypothetical protein